MKVIFLDFDGVILTLRTCAAHGRGWSSAAPDPVLSQVLRRVCGTGVRIVVSSAWRDMTTCRPKLAEADLEQFLHQDWRTGEINLEAARSRPAEIAEWLSRHPEVTDFRILDDEQWFWTEDQVPRFLKCCSENGAGARLMIALLEWSGMKNRSGTQFVTTDESNMPW